MKVVKGNIDIIIEILIKIPQKDIGASVEIQRPDSPLFEDVAQLRGIEVRKFIDEVGQEGCEEENWIGIFGADLVPDIIMGGTVQKLAGEGCFSLTGLGLNEDEFFSRTILRQFGREEILAE